MLRQKLTPEQALQKAKHFCAYQERSHAETVTKLYGFGLYKSDVERLISQLIEEGYLNEERFAIQFAGGKFRMKKWGRIKIQYELRLKKISSFNIKKALAEIDEGEYEKTLFALVSAKWKALKNEQHINRVVKTKNYLLQKGFEPLLIDGCIKKLREKE
jgi:regulatory protein